jgi:hypothetical protein
MSLVVVLTSRRRHCQDAAVPKRQLSPQWGLNECQKSANLENFRLALGVGPISQRSDAQRSLSLPKGRFDDIVSVVVLARAKDIPRLEQP